MQAVIAAGFFCLALAFYKVLPITELSFGLVFYALLTVVLGSRISVQIPRFNSHVTVSDTFIFLALLLFGGETAIILSAVEAFVSSWRFCNKKITVFSNAAVMAISLSVVVYTLRIFGIDPAEISSVGDGSTLVISLSAAALLQFVVNSGLASVYGALKQDKPIWETWKTHYLWTSITYFVGATSAGVLIKLIQYFGFAVVAATIPVIVFVYLTYRMYLKNVEMSVAQAEQAERHAEILEKQAIALRESEERFRSAFNYAPIGIALVSPSGNWLKVNHALCEILGYSEEEFLAADFQSMLFAEDLNNTSIKIYELLLGKIPNCQMEQRYRHKEGNTIWAAWSVSMASAASSESPNLIFQIQDITDKKFVEDKLHYEATHDALTNLPNRAKFMSRLDETL
ncbi:MAG TPA: PAS domain S-box protein, partial [Pyrinomonadaceae bacterium]